jgi:hypothetical protein
MAEGGEEVSGRGLTRREFIGATAAGGMSLAVSGAAPPEAARAGVPWHRRTYRWVQTNLNEQDPASYDPGLWADYWQRVRAQGVIVNAGGIVAYYPTQHPWHHRALGLGDRDLFGEVARAARAAGLTVLARMDSTRTYEPIFREHPDWFARDGEGRPFRGGDLYTVCVNGPWVKDCVPEILREIASRYRPDGFTDNSWSGLGQKSICYCDRCRLAFREETGLGLPARVDWDDRAYRSWIRWSYSKRTEIWETYNRVAREAGGPDCHWLGMCQGDPARMCEDFREPTAIWSRSPIVMLDWQSRRPGEGFEANAIAGTIVHGVLGWDRLIPESTALYLGTHRPMFRKSAKPEAEARLWAVSGMAGGIQPWWHHLGASQEDRRQLRTAERLSQWHADNQAYLVDRRPVATVGVLWSERNIDFYGRGEADLRTTLPFTGAIGALVEHRILWRAVHADHLDRDAPELDVIVLPNLAAMSRAQCESARRFVRAGGGLVATGECSLFDEEGLRLPDFALADLFGAHATGEHRGSQQGQHTSMWTSWEGHTYLRIASRAAGGAGPTGGGVRSPLDGLDETEILPFGGRIEIVRVDSGATVALTFVPDFPQSPPENVWMREPRTDFPALVLTAGPGLGRVAYLPVDLDRCYGRDRTPDHARLLANLVRWAARRAMPFALEGSGRFACHLYRQPERLVLHVVNLSNPAAWRPYATELIPVGPIRVCVAMPKDLSPAKARLLVAGGEKPLDVRDGWAELALDRVLDHEVVVFG